MSNTIYNMFNFYPIMFGLIIEGILPSVDKARMNMDALSTSSTFRQVQDGLRILSPPPRPDILRGLAVL